MSLRTGSGEIAITVFDRHPDWATSSRMYQFGPAQDGGVTIQPTKWSDGRFDIIVSDAEGSIVSLRGPELMNDGPVSVLVQWSTGTISLEVNKVKIESRSLRRASAHG